MAKFCANCGATLADESKFCPTCGAKVKTVEPVEEIPQTEEVVNGAAASAGTATRTVSVKVPDFKAIIDKIGMEKVKLFGIIGGAAIAVIVVISILISVLFPSPKAILKKGLDAMVDSNARQLVSVLPSFIYELDDDLTKNDYIEILEESMEDSYLEDVKYEIRKIEDVSSSEKKSLKENFEYLEEINDDFDASDITGYKKAKVRIDDGDDTYTKDFILIKYKGKWCIWISSGLL